MNIIPAIQDLLLRNQKVIVPGFGAFIIYQKPAQLNKITRVLTSPAIAVKFDRSLQADDGKLTGFLTQKLKLNSEVAIAALNDFKKDAEEKLGSGQQVNWEGFGSLSKKAGGEILFVAGEELLKRISIFEMPAMEVPSPVVKPAPPVTTIKEKIKTPVQEPVAASPATYRPSRKWTIPVVLLGLLLGMLAVIYITGNMSVLVSDIQSIFISTPQDSTHQLVFGNNITDTGEELDTITSQIDKELENQVDRSRALAIDKPEEATGSVPVVSVQSQEGIKSVSYARSWHIVAGSFTVLSNAEKQRSSFHAKGMDAEILPKKGRFYMVSLGSFDTPEEASAEKNKLKQAAGIELWIMKNKQEP